MKSDENLYKTKEGDIMKLEDTWLMVILVFIICFIASFGQGIFG
jgi:hypothetical protein